MEPNALKTAPKKAGGHRALDDIRESLEELRHYRQALSFPATLPPSLQSVSSPTYTKQEQEPASEEVTEVADGVLRMQLPISLPGLGHVNCYALVDGDGVALVDPGLPGPESWSALMARLKHAEIPVERVHTVVVTHSHPDHFGGSAQLREVAGADVLTHETFTSFTAEANDDLEPLIADMTEAEIVDLWKERFKQFGETPWGTRREPPPDHAIIRMIQADAGGQRFLSPEATIRVADGDRCTSPAVSGLPCTPPVTPSTTSVCGTRPMASCFRATTSSRRSPPHRRLDRGRRPAGDLLCFARSGSRTRGPRHRAPGSRPPLRGLPGPLRLHQGAPPRSPAVAARGAGGTGDAPVTEWMKVLFRERSWGDMAASETFAHLEHLRLAGEAVTHRDDDGLLYFELTDAG